MDRVRWILQQIKLEYQQYLLGKAVSYINSALHFRMHGLNERADVCDAIADVYMILAGFGGGKGDDG